MSTIAAEVINLTLDIVLASA